MSEENKAHQGKLSISRWHGTGGSGVSFEVEDAVSGSLILRGEISVAEFAEALFGLSNRPITFKVCTSVLGMKSEHRDILIPRPERTGKNFDRLAYVKRHAKDELKDGWKVFRQDDVTNHHNWAPNGMVRVGLMRWTEPQPITPEGDGT